jgi:superfamily II DNA or RNA helicase
MIRPDLSSPESCTQIGSFCREESLTKPLASSKSPVAVSIQDARADAPRIRWSFQGELRTEQERAVREMEKHDYGVLSAPPGAGKTVMGCALIARHRTAAQVLVYRAILLEQWREEAGRFLGLKRKEIGVRRGNRA